MPGDCTTWRNQEKKMSSVLWLENMMGRNEWDSKNSQLRRLRILFHKILKIRKTNRGIRLVNDSARIPGQANGGAGMETQGTVAKSFR